MNISNKAHYDECRLLTTKEAMLERECDCGVAYDGLYKRYLALEEKYYNLDLKYNNLRKGPIVTLEAKPDFDIELDYHSE